MPQRCWRAPMRPACPSQELPAAVRHGLVAEADIDAALQRYLASRCSFPIMHI